MSRVSDTRLRTREAAAHLVAAGRRPHDLRWSRSFGQSPGRNKLRPVPGIWF